MFTFRPRLIEAGRKPVARFPYMLASCEPIQIPAPFRKAFSLGMIAPKRNGRSRFNGNSFNATATSLVEDFPANFLTTWPRLMIEQTGRRWILCQLMSAIQTPGGVHNFA